MDRWGTTDEMLKQMLKKYNKLNKKTQDDIQDIFDSYNFNNDSLFNIADEKTRNKVNRLIDEYVEDSEIDTYTKYRINKVYGKSRIKNNDILDFLIFFCYIKERNKLTKYENEMFHELSNIEYVKAQEEVYNLNGNKNEVVSIKEEKIDKIISSPNPKGYIWFDYIMATVLYNSNQIYRQALIDIQQNRTLDITNDVYQNLLKAQRNKYLSVKDDIISGDLELESLYLVNSSIKEGYLKADSNAKVRFIAEMDKRTTDMCDTLNNQVFNVNDWNTYQRYSADDDRIVTYKTFGLEVGANLPPINNHFHWCRSTITYHLEIDSDNFKDIIYNANLFEDNIITNDFKNLDKKVEHLFIYDANTGKKLLEVHDNKESSVGGLKPVLLAMKSKPNSLVMSHNHPSNSSFSFTDIDTFNRYKSIDSTVVKTDKYLYYLEKNGINKLKPSELKQYYDLIKNANIKKYGKTIEMTHMTNIELSKKAGWNYGRISNK